AILLLPDGAAAKGWTGPSEILYMHAHDRQSERWNGPRMAFADADITEKTGFAEGRNFSPLKTVLRALAKDGYASLYTLLAPQGEQAGYPHLQNWREWLDERDPNVQMKQLGQKIAAMREIKSATELALLQKAIDASVEGHLAAMKMMR